MFRTSRSAKALFLVLSPVLMASLTITPLPAPAQQAGTSAASSDDVVARIKDEGLNRSQLMSTLSYLTDVIGPRLTASPNMLRANEWTKDKLTAWGLQNAHLEEWGPFGRGWSLEKFSAQVVSPQNIPVIAFPKAWSPGIKGPHVGEVLLVDPKTEEELLQYKGKLKGAIVLNGAMHELPAHFEPLGVRYTDEQLKQMESNVPAPRGPRAGGPFAGGGAGDFRARQTLANRKLHFFQEEGVALLVDPSPRGDGGTLFVQSATVPQPTPPTPPGGNPAPTAPPAGAPAAGTPVAGTPAAPRAGRGAGGAQARVTRISPWDKNAPKIVPQMVMADEHYNRLVRMIQQGEKLKMAVELDVKFYDKDLMGHNTVAEIPGTDLKDQVVMLGAHMDSWHSGTGATDNAAGCAVCMEAVRILKALNLKPRRTIRIALWSGEEEGLYGSHAYVAQHFAERATPSAAAPAGELPALTTKPDYEKFSGYFNLDNGTGKIRGIYLQGNNAVGSLFKEWLTPFKDMGASTVTLGNTGSTDHVSFDGVGLPGFQFIQDTIEYNTRTHHSNQDVYDRVQADDMKQAAIIMATFVYNTAMRDELLPRKPKP